MKLQYSKPVSLICGENWETDQVSPDERDGGYGVAMCLAYLQGFAPKLNELAEVLGCFPYQLEVAYKRLQINGIFTRKSPILDDDVLMFNKARTQDEMDASMKAWCHIAGISSGFIGRCGTRQEMGLSTKVAN